MPEGEDDVGVDLFADAVNRVAQEEAAEAGGDEEGDEAEPEDDFNAAWEVLDLARAIYDKGKDEDDEIKLKLADTYITLGDISLETGASRRIIYFTMHVSFTVQTNRKIRPSYHRLRSGLSTQTRPPPCFITPNCRGAL
jgi:hypothetical protein